MGDMVGSSRRRSRSVGHDEIHNSARDLADSLPPAPVTTCWGHWFKTSSGFKLSDGAGKSMANPITLFTPLGCIK